MALAAAKMPIRTKFVIREDAKAAAAEEKAKGAKGEHDES